MRWMLAPKIPFLYMPSSIPTFFHEVSLLAVSLSISSVSLTCLPNIGTQLELHDLACHTQVNGLRGYKGYAAHVQPVSASGIEAILEAQGPAHPGRLS